MTEAPAEPAHASPPRGRRLRGLVLYAVGAALLGAAVWTVARQGDSIQTAWESARGASPAVVVLLLALPLVNCFISVLVFWTLTNRYGRVGLGEMSALIASAWLLNNLPMRPGLVGRVAYHKAVNGIRVADSVRVLISAAGCTAAAAGVALVMAMFAAWLGAGGAWLAALAAAPLLVGVAAGAAIRAWAGGAQVDLPWRLAAAAGLRYIDVLVWAVRYWLVFRLVGSPVGPAGAAVIAAASQGAMLVPVQLGVREWMVGVAASILPPGLWSRGAEEGAAASAASMNAAGIGVAPGLLADLVNRAAEIVVALPVGIAAGAWLAGRQRGAGRGSEETGARERA